MLVSIAISTNRMLSVAFIHLPHSRTFEAPGVLGGVACCAEKRPIIDRGDVQVEYNSVAFLLSPPSVFDYSQQQRATLQAVSSVLLPDEWNSRNNRPWQRSSPRILTGGHRIHTELSEPVAVFTI